MSATSRVPAALAYLVAEFTAAATLGQAVPPVTVIDGPEVTADPGPLALWVGVDSIDPAGQLPLAAASAQVWQGGLDRSTRVESLTVSCVAQAQSGNDDVASLRAAADAIKSAAEALVRADPSLGGLLAGTSDAAVTTAEWRQGPVQGGMAVRVAFTIDATAFISS